MLVADAAVLPPRETKTARKKRLKADRDAAALAGLTAAALKVEQARRERVMARLNLKYCSDWWAEEMRLGRGPYYPNAACDCRACKGLRKWPSPVVPPWCICYECHVLEVGTSHPLRGQPGITHDDEDGDDDVARWGRRRISRRESKSLGLRIIRRSGQHVDTPKGITVMLGICERCEGLRPYGERFCMACRAIVQREMREDGYPG